MKNLLLIILLITFTGNIYSQSCKNNPNLIDQYPILSVSLLDDPNSVNDGTMYGCMGLVKISFTLNDNNTPSGLMPEWFDGNVILTFGMNLSSNIYIENVRFNIDKTASTPTYEYIVELKNYNINLNLVSNYNTIVLLKELDPSNGFNPDWDWAYNDPKLCGNQYMGDVLYDNRQFSFYATGELTSTITNNFSKQTFINYYNLVLTSGQYCQNSNLKFDFEFNISPKRSNFYCLYDIELYKFENNQYKYIGTYNQTPILPTLVKSTFYKYSVDINLPIAFSPQNDYYVKLTNISFRDGPSISNKPLKEAKCWQWAYGKDYSYGANPIGYKSDFIKIGKRTMPANTYSNGCQNFSGTRLSNQIFTINNITNKGTIFQPVTTCFNLNLNMFKSLDVNPCASYSYKYKIELYECSPNFDEKAFKGENLDIFNGNTSTTFTGTNATLFNSYILNLITNGYVGPKYFKIVYKGYVDNCPDFDETFSEVYFILNPGAIPNLTIKVNGVGNSTDIALAKFQNPVKIPVLGPCFSNILDIYSNKPLYSSYVKGRLRKSTPNGDPDMSNSGIIWSSSYNEICYPSFYFGTGTTKFGVEFGAFGGNKYGLGGGQIGYSSTAPGCSGNYNINGQSCPQAWTDLQTFISPYYNTFTPFSQCTTMTSLGPQMLHGNLFINPSLYSTIPATGDPTSIPLFLEIFTTDDCGGNSPSSFLKVNIFEPVDYGANISFPILARTGDNVSGSFNLVNNTTSVNNFNNFQNSNSLPNYSQCFNSEKVYNLGRNTGFIEIKPLSTNQYANMNIDYIKLRIERFTPSTGWQYVFNPDGANIYIHNNKNNDDLSTYNPFRSIKLPINDPYGNYQYKFGNYGNGQLWVNGGSKDMFKNPANMNNLYRVHLMAGHQQNTLNRLPLNLGNSTPSGEIIGYFMCNEPGVPNSLNNRSTQQTVNYQPISSEGEANFFIDNNQLKLNLIVPEGGDLTFSLYDMTGRELFNSPKKTYETGVFKVDYPYNITSEGMFIINYTLNGEKKSIKIQNK